MLGKRVILACKLFFIAEVAFVSSNAFPSSLPGADPSIINSSKLPLEELRIFTEVMQHIKAGYVEEISDAELLEYAIKGMLNGLDPHSAYLQPDDFKVLEESTSGQFGGLGMEVSMQDGFIKVIAPIDDSPAAKAGVKPGDIIIKLDNEQVKGLSLRQAVEYMRGKVGKPIRLTILRENSSVPMEIKLVRQIIHVRSVKSRMLEPGYGYLRISQFQVDTGKELVKQINLLKNKEPKPLKGLILDLRNNPGGVLQAAVDVADTFLDQGLIVYTKGRIESTDMRYSASPTNISGNIPLVVLINEGSASASEIVAGALQDHRRAVVVGAASFGKGSVQTVLPLSSDSKRALKLTTARYYTPLGHSIQAEGIRPDVAVRNMQITAPTNEIEAYRESTLQGHLKNSQSNKKKSTEFNAYSDLDEKDYYLSQALNVLKGMWVVKNEQ